MVSTDFYFINAGKFISRGVGRHVIRTIDTMELIYVISGTLDMFEEDQQFHLGPGDFLYLYPGKRHGGLSAYSQNLSFFWGHFSGDPEILKQKFPKSGYAGRTERMGDYIAILLAEQNQPDHPQNCDLLFTLLMNETQLPKNNASQTYSNLAKTAERIIKLRFAEKISTAEIAGELQCNPDYLGRVFRNQFHCTLTEYLNNIRLKHAENLLASGYSTIKEAAYRSGFSDMAYFRRCFLKKYSMRPGEYRRRRLSGHINT